MTIAFVHKDEQIYIQMSPEKFESLLIEYVEKYGVKEAVRQMVAELKREALTK